MRFAILLLLLVKTVSSLICLQCDEVFQPRHCHYVKQCAQDEVCGSKRIVTKFGVQAYKLGCVKNDTCPNSNPGHNATSCVECCRSGDLCNSASCGEPGYPPSRGPVCYNCEDYNRPEDCHRIAYCKSDQVCNIQRIIEFGDVVYSTNCIPKRDCPSSIFSPSAVIGKRFLSQRDSDVGCVNCCEHDFCNHNCSVDPCIPSPCQNGATCSVIGMTYRCNCRIGWIGQNCDILQDSCASSPCHYGTCRHTTSHSRYECICESGWTGQYCAQKKRQGFDCKDILENRLGTTDGVYTILLNGTIESLDVYCDMTTDGGGWTVFQRRFNGSVDFYRNFSEYENGFGSAYGEFWLGLKYMYKLTHGFKSDLRLDLVNGSGNTMWEKDRGFRIVYPPFYAFNIDGWTSSIYQKYKTNTGMGYYSGHPFSTSDKDRSGYHCGEKGHGGWWYSACSDVNLNGKYVTPGTVFKQNQHDLGYGGVIYVDWSGFKSLKSTKMMFRRT